MSTLQDTRSALGRFSGLPVELRIMIWKQLFPESRPTNSFCSPKAWLAILRTSRHLSTEILTELYNGRILTFHIAPNPLPSDQMSTIEVYDQYGSRWCLYPRFQRASDQQASCFSVWRDLPFHKLRSVMFELEAPDPADPGQMIQMWNKLCWLLDLMQHVKGFPEVEVHVLQTVHRDWCADGELQKTLHDRLSSMMTEQTTDLEILLSPFLRLRNVTSIKVDHPFNGEHETLDKVVSNILRKARSTPPLGLDFEDDYRMDDEMIVSLEDTYTVWFDYVLDDLPGPTAAFVRLERFWNWSPQYDKNMWCLIRGKCEMGGALLFRPELCHAQDALEDRYCARLAFHPMSSKHVQEDENNDNDSRYGVLEDSPEGDVLSTGMDGWCPVKWWAYREGIPRISSAEYKNHIDKYGRADANPFFGIGDGWHLERLW